MIRDDFAVLILTHGRADKVYTIKRVLEAGNYTGKYYLVIDDEDDQAGEYIKRYGREKVQVFCKQAVDDRIDTMDTFHEHRAIVYARNAAFDVARKLGLKYFLEFDDDYIDCQFRADDGRKLKVMSCRDLDTLFESMLDFLDDTGALTVAFCQGGDFNGGKNNSRLREQVLRKAMNSFFCRVDKPVDFFGTINEDVNMYTLLGSRGGIDNVYRGSNDSAKADAENRRRNDRIISGWWDVQEIVLQRDGNAVGSYRESYGKQAHAYAPSCKLGMLRT